MEPDNDETRTHVTLTSGVIVSHYRIISKIGAGGMGEVYLAEDTNLKRQIAIKVLPDIFGSDQERLARFEREAKLLASVNHPNLATIHGLEDVQGKRLLVMELVEGETLAERIANGPLPLDEALDVFRQIAAGMEAAHEKGIIHRDLKPANIKITPEGKVKILDFGLAKALHGDTAVSDLANSPTITENMTRAGVILGTAAYMSPEQAKGKPVDKRTDIWAFGCIVFECLTGKRDFEVETVSDTLAAILRGEPEWNKLPQETPPYIKSLLHRCLRKDASRRLRDIGDAMLDASDAMASALVLDRRDRFWRASVPWAVATLLLVLAAYQWYTGQRIPPADKRPTISSILAPENSVNCFRDGIAISPDGSKIAFSSLSSREERLIWVRSLDRPDATPLLGTDGAIYPFWSPDSKNIAFYAGGWLKRIPAEGGPVQKLCQASMSAAWGGSWGTSGRILFCDAHEGTSKVAETGGEPETIPGGMAVGFPSFLPDGKRFVCIRVSGPYQPASANSSIWLSSLDELGFGKEINGTSGLWGVEWVPPDWLFLYKEFDRSLAFHQLELSSGTTVGPRRILAERVVSSSGWPAFSVSHSGAAVFLVNPQQASNDVATRLVWVDRRGNRLGYLGEVGGYWYLRISPDDRRVICNPDDDTWVFESASGLLRRVTHEVPASGAYDAIWSPASDRILVDVRDGLKKEYLLSGGPPGEVFNDTVAGSSLTDWSRDGKYVLCDRNEFRGNRRDVTYFDFATHQIKPLVATPAQEQAGHFSPDGHWVAFVSNESGTDEVYVVSFPDGTHLKRVSYAGGRHPRWPTDGKELFFLAPGWTVMSATVDLQPELEISTPVALFQMTMADINQGDVSPYDVAPDGQRFLINSPQAKPVPLTLVQNWQALVDR